MASDALRKELQTTFAKDLYNNFSNDSDDQYFIVLGKVDSWGITVGYDESGGYGTTGDSYPAVNVDSVEKAFQAWRDGIGAKRISSRNIYHMIRRYNWTYDTVYDEYNHTENLFDTTPKQHFIYTINGNVYKCMSNNGDAKSKYEPTHTIPQTVTLQDGYKWKFVYKVTEDSRNFITDDYIPIQYVIDDNIDATKNQWDAQQASVNGAIEHIDFTSVSSILSNAIWERSTDPLDLPVLQQNSGAGATAVYLASTDNNDDDYYNGYAIYFSANAGVGQRRIITDYDGGDRMAYFDVPLLENVESTQGEVEGTRYRIMPDIVFDGDGVSAEAIATMDSNKQITGVQVINNGKKYTVCVPRLLPLGVSGGTLGESLISGKTLAGPTLSPIISPPGGHSKNALNDLHSDKIMIRATIKGDDSNFVVAQDFRQVSILKNPTIRGGTYDGWTAGYELVKRKQMTVVEPYFSTTGFNDQTFLSTSGATGDSIIGERSNATAKIQNWTWEGTQGVLELSNVQGRFELDNPASSHARIVFKSDASGSTGAFNISRTVKQHNGLEGASGATAVGTVVDWSGPIGGPYELIVDVTSNLFLSTGTTIEEYYTGNSAGFSSGLYWEGSFDAVERRMGELLKHFSSTQGITFEFTTQGSQQNLARADKLKDVQDEEILEKSYRLTHKFIIEDSGSALTDSSYDADSLFYQKDSITGIMKTGKIVKWSKSAGASGELHLNEVRGNFATGGFSTSTGGSIPNHTIVSIDNPDLNIGSGQVLYIQNINSITKNYEQDEEVKIMLGFDECS
ncbi:MAG: hypothetical protein H8D80_01835 [Proteobacteria bacterium]|nr:hypothetical protein [Pseudomonadota bacterium]